MIASRPGSGSTLPLRPSTSTLVELGWSEQARVVASQQHWRNVSVTRRASDLRFSFWSRP